MIETEYCDGRRLLHRYGIRPKKRLGQHFLKNETTAQEIVGALSLNSGDTVLEIGPGFGILSRYLVERAHNVIAVEIDNNLSALLADRFSHVQHFHLLHTDILRSDLQRIRSQYRAPKLKIVGNLPYSITTPVLFFLLRYKSEIKTIVVTIQKEVAERILSPPGRKEYGALSVAIQYHASAERILEIPANAFYPKPKVDSTVLRLRILEHPSVSVQNETLFFQVVRSAFGQRRKMLHNALSGAFALAADQLADISGHSGIDLKRRGETLSLHEFARLSDSMESVRTQVT